jgi:hypothetical protein
MGASMTELQSLWQLLCGKFGWSPAVLTWIGAFRTVLKFFSARIQTNLTAIMVRIAQSADQEDDRDFDALLQARWYRVTQFVLDLVFSFKLPTHSDFVKEKQSMKDTKI